MSEYRGDHEGHGESPFAVWGAALLKEPDATLDRILSGIGGTRNRSSGPNRMTFWPISSRTPDHQEIRTQLTDHLDRALLRWIEVRSEWSSRCIVAFGPRAYAAQMADALAVAARLSLKTTAGELMRNHVVWDDRFHVLRRPGDIDLLREFDMVLALHQTDVRFVPRWFAACGRGGMGQPLLADAPQRQFPWPAQAAHHERRGTGDDAGDRSSAIWSTGAVARNEIRSGGAHILAASGGDDHSLSSPCRVLATALGCGTRGASPAVRPGCRYAEQLARTMPRSPPVREQPNG